MTIFLIILGIIAVFGAGYFVGSKNPADKVKADLAAKYQADRTALTVVYEAKLAALKAKLPGA